MQELSVTSEQIIALSSAAVALAAVSVSVWQGHEMRRHNRRSVKPHLTFYTYFNSIKPYAGIELSNNGIGPAIIESFTLFVAGQPITDRREGGWPAALERLGLESEWTYNWLDRQDGVRVGESVWLLGIESQVLTKAKEEALRAALARLRIRIDYRTVYGEDLFLEIKEHVRARPCSIEPSPAA